MTKEHLIKAREQKRHTMIEEMIDGNLDNVNARVAYSAMKQGDEVGKEIVEEYISYLATGVTNIINIFQRSFNRRRGMQRARLLIEAAY